MTNIEHTNMNASPYGKVSSQIEYQSNSLQPLAARQDGGFSTIQNHKSQVVIKLKNELLIKKPETLTISDEFSAGSKIKLNILNLDHLLSGIVVAFNNSIFNTIFNRLEISFNGEIYNYLELRRDENNYPYKTSGDMEVILPLASK